MSKIQTKGLSLLNLIKICIFSNCRMWEFSVGLYMINLWPNSLILAAVYGAVESASSALLGPLVGKWVDMLTYTKVHSISSSYYHRLLWITWLVCSLYSIFALILHSQVLRLWLLTKNLSFMVAGGSVIAVLACTDLMSINFAAFMLLIILINVSGAAAVLSNLAGTILIEREWWSTQISISCFICIIARFYSWTQPCLTSALICRVVVISEGHPPELQTNMNAIIRRIDLVCKLFAPVISGCIISFISLTASAMALALWNIISVCVEYWLLTSVCNGIPALRESSQRRALRSLPNSIKIIPSVSHEEESFLDSDKNAVMETSESSWWRKIGCQVSRIPYISAWKVYLQQDVVFPGFALALLYFTILR